MRDDRGNDADNDSVDPEPVVGDGNDNGNAIPARDKDDKGTGNGFIDMLLMFYLHHH